MFVIIQHYSGLSHMPTPGLDFQYENKPVLILILI